MEEHAKHSMLYYSNDPQALINIKRYHTIINQVVQIISVSDQQMNPNMNSSIYIRYCDDQILCNT
jgi:hypothetical protein